MDGTDLSTSINPIFTMIIFFLTPILFAAIQASHKSRYPDWEGSAGHTAGEPGIVRWYAANMIGVRKNIIIVNMGFIDVVCLTL